MDFAQLAVDASNNTCKNENDKNIYQKGFLNGVIITQNEAIESFERVFDKFIGNQNEPYWINLKFQLADNIRKDLANFKK